VNGGGEMRWVLPQATVIHVETDPLMPAPASGVWWDVPVAEVSETAGTGEAARAYQTAKRARRHLL